MTTREVLALPEGLLYFPNVFSPTDPFGEGRLSFRLALVMSAGRVSEIPGWVSIRDDFPAWVPAGHIAVNLGSLFRIPVFGLPDGFVDQVRDMNMDLDRVLVQARPRVRVSVARSSRKDRRGQVNFADPICVEIIDEVRLPTAEDIRQAAAR